MVRIIFDDKNVEEEYKRRAKEYEELRKLVDELREGERGGSDKVALLALRVCDFLLDNCEFRKLHR